LPEDPVDLELEQITGNKKMAAELRQNLEKLKGGAAGPDLAEMARDVLAGRITLRDVTRSSAYATPLTDAMSRFHDHQAQLSEEEKAELLKQAEERFTDD
jgi:hypothetical protein